MADFILANGYQNTKLTKFNPLQNFPLYGMSNFVHVHVHVHVHVESLKTCHDEGLNLGYHE